MTNAIVVPQAFTGQVAAVFQGQQAGDDLSGGITGGYGLIKYRGKVWSIQHQGNNMTLMRDDGDGPRGSIDVVIVKANPHLSKTFYLNGWDENNNNPPDCASANGVTPDAGVPHQQSTVCATCPRNAWGSAPNGGKGKACGDHRRLAVVPLPAADAPNALDVLRNEALGGALLLRCPAASLQDMAAFDSRYKQLGYPYFTMGIKIGFDPAESFPKFTFQAIRPLTDKEGEVVMALRSSPETARVISDTAVAAPAATQPASDGAFMQQLPAGTQTAAAAQPAPAQQVPVQPAVAQPAPVAAQPQPAAQPAAAPATNLGGFGAAVAQPAAGQTAEAAPAAQPQASRAAMAMTGFGGVTSEVPPAQVQPAPAQPAPTPTPAPAVAVPAATPEAPAAAVTAGPQVSAFEGSIDERLNALLGSS